MSCLGGDRCMFANMVYFHFNCKLFNITPSGLVPVLLWQITFAKDTNSNIVEDKQNTRAKISFTPIFLVENKKHIVDGL